MQDVAVIGAGSWGTALALLLSGKGHRVTLWGHRPEHVARLAAEGENASYLPGFPFRETLAVTASLEEAVTGRSVVVMVVPSHGYRAVFAGLKDYLEPRALVVSATKGIEKETLLTMTQVMEEEIVPLHHQINLAVLSGPSFAKEVARGVPTAVTVASRSGQAAKLAQDVFFTERFRVYASTDVIGIELGGALKNVVAIASGISDGLGYGTNTRAALITRGLTEIARLGVKLGANPLTFSGLAGLGDLVLTCTGDLSRNRMVGLQLGQGMKLGDILKEMHMVAEGVNTARSAWDLTQRHRVDMPILEQIFRVLHEDRPCAEAVQALLGRHQKEELDYLG